MASGEQVVQILQVSPPAATFPALTRRAGGSTPAENALVWAFDTTTIEYLDFLCVLVGYGGGGLTFTIPWSAATATTLGVTWEIGIRRLADDAEDVDTAHTYDYNSVDDTCASASGELSYPTLAFTDGVDMDSWANGELAIVRIRRNTGDAQDTMAGDAEMWALVGRES